MKSPCPKGSFVLRAAACAATPLLQPGACQQGAERGRQGPAPAKIWGTQVKARESCADHPDSQAAEEWSAGRSCFLVPALLSGSVSDFQACCLTLLLHYSSPNPSDWAWKSFILTKKLFLWHLWDSILHFNSALLHQHSKPHSIIQPAAKGGGAEIQRRAL